MASELVLIIMLSHTACFALGYRLGVKITRLNIKGKLENKRHHYAGSKPEPVVYLCDFCATPMDRPMPICPKCREKPQMGPRHI